MSEDPLGFEKTPGSSAGATPGAVELGEPESDPLHSLLFSFTMIIVSEIGDKTFLVAALMAMRHPRLLVFPLLLPH